MAIVIIWGADDFNTLGLLRQLSNIGLRVFFLIKGKKSCASRSKYCLEYFQVKTNEEGLEYLLKNLADEHKKSVILTSGDGISVFLDKNKHLLEKFFIVPGTSQQGILEFYTDKNRMTGLAGELGFNIPKSYYLKKNTEVPYNIKYPCIIKPSHQKPGHYNEFKFKICKSENELKRSMSFVRYDSEFILQEFVPKNNDVLVYGARLRDNNVIFAGAYIRDRLAECGSSSHGVIQKNIPSSIDKNLMVRFLETIGYYGLFSFEYGEVGEKAYFFEVNLRNDGTSHYFYQSGANIPLAYVCSCLNMTYNNLKTVVEGENYFIDELFDYENVLNGTISHNKWKSDLAQATVFKYYDKDDIGPWKYMKSIRLRKMFQEMLLKRWRVYIVYVLDKLGLRK